MLVYHSLFFKPYLLNLVMYGVIFSLEFHNTSKESWKCSREERKQSWKLQSMAGTLPVRHLQKRGLELNQMRWIQLLLIIREGKKTGSRKCRELAQGTEEALCGWGLKPQVWPQLL